MFKRDERIELTVLSGLMHVKGDPISLAAYTVAVLEIMKAQNDHGEKEKNMNDMTFEDLLEAMIKSGRSDEEDE